MHFSVEEQVSAKAGLDDVEDDLVDMVRGGPIGNGDCPCDIPYLS